MVKGMKVALIVFSVNSFTSVRTQSRSRADCGREFTYIVSFAFLLVSSRESVSS